MTLERPPARLVLLVLLVVAATWVGGCAYGGSPESAPDLGLEALLNDEPGVDALPGGAMMVIHAGDHSYGVLAASAPESWGAGAIEPVELAAWSPSTAREPIDPSAVPGTLIERQGLRVEAYDATGFACTARLGAMSLVRRAWIYDEEVTPGASPEERAEQVWEQTDRTALVAELEDIAGDCGEAVIAMPTAVPVPEMYFALDEAPDSDDARRAAAAAAFAARPTTIAFEHHRVSLPPEDRPTASEPTITTWRNAQTGRTLLSASVYAACDDAGPGLEIVLDGDDPGLALRSERMDGWLSPAVMLDLDADGLLDAVTIDAVTFDFGSAHERVHDVAPANLPCPC